jgi:histidine kinase
LILLLSVITWAYFNIRFQKEDALNQRVIEVERLGNTIVLGTRYAMMLNAREDITQIIGNIAQQKEVEFIRIINKEGVIEFSNIAGDVHRSIDTQTEACVICHRQDPPRETVKLAERVRILDSRDSDRKLGIISPIYNEPACSTAPCHVHPSDKRVLGLMDFMVSLESTDTRILSHAKEIAGLAVLLFLLTAVIISLFLVRFVNRPIKKLIAETRQIGDGQYDNKVAVDRPDEIGELAKAIDQMRRMIGEKQEELKKQRYEYQTLFEGSPCYITVQDRNLKIIRSNLEFQNRFSPQAGDYCYRAYKGRSDRCEICPVIKTFEDGEPHFSEEAAVASDGTESYWMVRTSPIKNSHGEVIAAMEMSLDLTHMRFLEKEAKKSEQKYRTIFNTIPNPTFVLDHETLEVLDCNDSVHGVYGFPKEELLHTSFLSLFPEEDREDIGATIRTSHVMNRAKQIRADGQPIYVNIHISSSEYSGKRVFLVTTGDITMQLMAEQQLIQASKMATLGEMATGVAHELNQPLSVIKTASSFIKRKVTRGEAIDEQVLKTMAEEMDGHVDRAEKIISHMREFGRKSEVAKERVQVNDVLKKALDFFRQQLKLREIEVEEMLERDLPLILADSNRLEQVFINLLINARDAIEKKWDLGQQKEKNKRIGLRTGLEQGLVTIRVTDNGTGIRQSILDRIFEPFFTTKKAGKGTGLGLSISYSIVRDYEGTIRVESVETEGATFIIRFPPAEEA